MQTSVTPGANSNTSFAERRLSLTPARDVRYPLNTLYRDGTTHVVLEPLDFMARLAALVSRPARGRATGLRAEN